MGKCKYLWMAVTADEYELPLAVADTARELGEIYGLKAKTIVSAEFRKVSGKGLGRKYVKVEK